MPNTEHRTPNAEAKGRTPRLALRPLRRSSPGPHFDIRRSVFGVRCSPLAFLASMAFLLAWCQPSAAGEKIATPPQAADAKALRPPMADLEAAIENPQSKIVNGPIPPAAGPAVEAPLSRPASQPAAGGAKPAEPKPSGSPSAARLQALRDRLAQEKERLAQLRGELQEAQDPSEDPDEAAEPEGDAPTAAFPSPIENPKSKIGNAAVPPSPGPPSPAEAKATAALVANPHLGAADSLFRLGRYADARAVYEAFAQQPKAAESDHVWALLQAGHCCRWLGDADAAIARFQQILADYPDSPWSKAHVAWALRAAQWDKRWRRSAPVSGE